MQSFVRVSRLTNWSSGPASQKRYLFRWLTFVFNHVDEQLIQQLGPEVAAAQWLLRNGASVKWSKNESQLFNNYDKLMSDPSLKKDFIVEIDARESSISHFGFPYLKNLKGLKKIIFNDAKYLDNRGLILLSQYQLPSLKHLEIINCSDITDEGVLSLGNLKSLDSLKLQNLYSVKDLKGCVDVLKRDLVKCQIEYG